MIAAIDELIAARERSPMVNRSALKARFEILTLAAAATAVNKNWYPGILLSYAQA